MSMVNWLRKTQSFDIYELVDIRNRKGPKVSAWQKAYMKRLRAKRTWVWKGVQVGITPTEAVVLYRYKNGVKHVDNRHFKALPTWTPAAGPAVQRPAQPRNTAAKWRPRLVG
jgi:hypothetical protein